MNQALLCKCDTVLLKSVNDETKLRCKVLIFKGDKAFAVCKGCDTEIQVPLKIDEEMMKSMNTNANNNLKLYIKK